MLRSDRFLRVSLRLNTWIGSKTGIVRYFLRHGCAMLDFLAYDQVGIWDRGPGEATGRYLGYLDPSDTTYHSGWQDDVPVSAGILVAIGAAQALLRSRGGSGDVG